MFVLKSLHLISVQFWTYLNRELDLLMTKGTCRHARITTIGWFNVRSERFRRNIAFLSIAEVKDLFYQRRVVLSLCSRAPFLALPDWLERQATLARTSWECAKKCHLPLQNDTERDYRDYGESYFACVVFVIRARLLNRCICNSLGNGAISGIINTLLYGLTINTCGLCSLLVFFLAPNNTQLAKYPRVLYV